MGSVFSNSMTFLSDNTIRGACIIERPFPFGPLINNGLMEATESLGFTFIPADAEGAVVDDIVRSAAPEDSSTIDFNVIAQNWQTLQSTWTAGDLNYDGIVDLLDLVMVAQHLQTPVNFSATPATLLSQLPAVPEPTSIALLLPATLLLRRKRPK
jgi:hypothetical protein